MSTFVTASDEWTQINELAYRHWETRGRPLGDAVQDWLTAELEFKESQAADTRSAHLSDTDKSSDLSFPASDPPASHLPDIVPVNAEAKWTAAAVQNVDIPLKRTGE